MAGSERGATSNFSQIAFRYDATREVPETQMNACYERLVSRGVLPTKGLILDAGCGTGQISLVLAQMGYEVQGYDVSPEMVAIAQSKSRPAWRARYAVADVRSLPENDHAFDAIIVSKLFQHVQDWKEACLELLRVLRPGACLVELNDRGAFGNSVRKHFASRADALGYTERYVGLDPHERAPLAVFLIAHGCERIAIDLTDLKWNKSIAYGDALRELRERLFAEFWYLPVDAYQQILDDTSRWVDEQPEGRNKLQLMTPFLSAEVFRKL